MKKTKNMHIVYNNKNEILCNQTFIDEGFVNFDKYNLSIVPNFLKSLLLYFNNVIIVSHIDMIQDNIDEIAQIKYNKITGVSEMTYNNQKNNNQKDKKYIFKDFLNQLLYYFYCFINFMLWITPIFNCFF